MIAPLTNYQNSLPAKFTSKPKVSSGLSQVFAAAIVNQQFCNMLLQDPSTALQKGYMGQTFALSKNEQDLIMTIRAKSLSDLAKQINRSLLITY